MPGLSLVAIQCNACGARHVNSLNKLTTKCSERHRLGILLLYKTLSKNTKIAKNVCGRQEWICLIQTFESTDAKSPMPRRCTRCWQHASSCLKLWHAVVVSNGCLERAQLKKSSHWPISRSARFWAASSMLWYKSLGDMSASGHVSKFAF